MFHKKELNNIPSTTGIYIFLNSLQEIIYIGKALNLKERIRSYFLQNINLKTKLLIKEAVSFKFIKVSSEVEALILEANLVKKYLPKFNINLRDDKSFLYIAISKEEFPRVFASRKKDLNIKIKYQFGPFPNTGNVRNVLRTIRKIFPYCTQSPKTKKPCFYSHINLCNPCPVFIRKQNKKLYTVNKAVYRKNLLYIKKFLEGKLPELVKLFNKQMKQYSQQQQFEKAQSTHKIIQQLEYITKPYYKISGFLEDPNFLENLKETALTNFVSFLKPYFPDLSDLTKIEAVDISNIQGKEATGSLVVFINGQKEKQLYKRFKLKSCSPNDTDMIREVLVRRFKHIEWKFPDLLIIDGGKPQVTKAMQITAGFGNIPVIGLAKRLETLIILHNNRFVEINLPLNSGVLRLVQEIRDEAHRFAIQYHHLLRKKLIRTNLSL